MVFAASSIQKPKLSWRLDEELPVMRVDRDAGVLDLRVFATPHKRKRAEVVRTATLRMQDIPDVVLMLTERAQIEDQLAKATSATAYPRSVDFVAKGRCSRSLIVGDSSVEIFQRGDVEEQKQDEEEQRGSRQPKTIPSKIEPDTGLFAARS